MISIDLMRFCADVACCTVRAQNVLTRTRPVFANGFFFSPRLFAMICSI